MKKRYRNDARGPKRELAPNSWHVASILELPGLAACSATQSASVPQGMLPLLFGVARRHVLCSADQTVSPLVRICSDLSQPPVTDRSPKAAVPNGKAG